MLLVMILTIPVLAALLQQIVGEKSIKIIPFITSVTVFILGIVGAINVFQGELLIYEISLSGPFSPIFRANPLSMVFVVLTTLIWVIISIYTPEYMKHEEGNFMIYQSCSLVTLSAILGVFLAGDFLTMLFCFELMTIASYFWVIHRWNKEAIKGGYYYLFFSIVGGLFIALGLVLLNVATGELPQIGSPASLPINNGMFVWSIILFILGFGIKAGMAPLHLWLPYAHSVSPTPSSALLSGLLIKVGAYGIIRVGDIFGWGTELIKQSKTLGTCLTILGICTMVVGVVVALLQSDAKKLLAYHSISQMGYIILGLGIGLYLGRDGIFGSIGSVYHIINHALFKAALFLGVGIVYMKTKETNLYKLGGLWRQFPITAIFMLLAVLGITGTPGFNGYIGKTLIHHGVSMAAKSGVLWIIWVERIFLLVGVGTAASFSKLYYLMFFAKPAGIRTSRNKFSWPQFALGLLTIPILAIGFKPKFLLNNTLIPAVQALGMGNVSAFFVGFSFWNPSDIIGMFITLALGILLCGLGLKSGMFNWHPPIWLTLEGLWTVTGRTISMYMGIGIKFYRSIVTVVLRIGNAINYKALTVLRRFSRERRSIIGGLTLTGLSADAGLLITTLVLLIVWYTLININPLDTGLYSFLIRWVRQL